MMNIKDQLAAVPNLLNARLVLCHLRKGSVESFVGEKYHWLFTGTNDYSNCSIRSMTIMVSRVDRPWIAVL